MSGFGDLNALSELLQTTSEDVQQDTTAAQHAAHFGGGAAPTTVVAKQPKKEEPKKDEGEIWDVDEVPDEEGLKLQQPQGGDVKDGRAVCKHEIYFKQSVDSSDVYLGLSDKTPGSTDCTHIVVKGESDRRVRNKAHRDSAQTSSALAIASFSASVKVGVYILRILTWGFCFLVASLPRSR